MIVYPWHPFFGMTVQISHNRRGKKLNTIHTDIKPGYSREVPPWMLDPSFCARMSKGPPEVNIESLNELAILLASLGKTRKRRASSSSSNLKERQRAEKKMWRSSATQAEVRQSNTTVPVGRDVKGLVEALADLLMASMGQRLLEIPTVKGGVDEQDHA